MALEVQHLFGKRYLFLLNEEGILYLGKIDSYADRWWIDDKQPHWGRCRPQVQYVPKVFKYRAIHSPNLPNLRKLWKTNLADEFCDVKTLTDSEEAALIRDQYSGTLG